MKNTIALLLLLCAFTVHAKTKNKSKIKVDKIDAFSTKGVLDLMEVTSTWQVDNSPIVMELPSGIIEPLTTHNWVRATFLSGMMAYHDVAKDDKILDYIIDLCEDVDYELGDRFRHADEFAIGKVYADIYLKTRDKSVLVNMKTRIDSIIANPTRASEVGWDGEKNWSWCDALFMAPPAWLKLYTCTGKRIYLNEMDHRFWENYHHLYSKEDSLYYRDARFVWDGKDDLKTENGYKIFWGRGNGWVVGALCDILTYIPGDYHHRAEYKQVYLEMMAKIASLQAEDGMWRSSLLDYEQYPSKEFSASAFFCYAMAWGINHRMLDKEEYWPYIEKAWKGMVDCIQPDGKIGFVQRVGADPRTVKAEDTMEYGCGAFLLAGKEMHEILEKEETR